VPAGRPQGALTMRRITTMKRIRAGHDPPLKRKRVCLTGLVKETLAGRAVPVPRARADACAARQASRDSSSRGWRLRATRDRRLPPPPFVLSGHAASLTPY